MASDRLKTVRCAIYTRKSTDHGLELEFNSLDAQREACEAYVKSQAPEGWRTLPQRYDDPAFSGGTLERPALQQLLKDIDAGNVDIVVVYKIDRLTRSLADFAKLIEVFDFKKISFVAVTQQFNTTTSMGRLTLNVLLSFAQFERELASERVRDKVAASRRKGKWTGGSIPLGYDCQDKKLVVNAKEAETVRYIFNQYLKLKNFRELVADLDRKSIFTKIRITASGCKVGGIPFTYGPLAYLLKSRTYLGETGYSGEWFKGEHEPIVDAETFTQVQDLLKDNAITRISRRSSGEAVLAGLLFDDRGNRMTPSFSAKNGVRYRFYVSSALLKGRKEQAGSRSRVSSTEIESIVVKALQAHAPASSLSDRDLINTHVTRVSLGQMNIKIVLKTSEAEIDVPWAPPPKRGLVRIENLSDEPAPEPNPALVQALARAHSWLKLLTEGAFASIEELAASEKLNPKVVRKAIRVAFLAPAIAEAILNGHQPISLSMSRLQMTLPLEWREQQRKIGVDVQHAKSFHREHW